MVDLENFETREEKWGGSSALIGGIWIPLETLYEIAFDLEEAEKLKLDTDIPIEE